ncbi:hypothetical protein FSP39_015864 [Pinctada imbricata]|uniref:Sulfotransferase domain-containing protein n=1 Tax=Pinctada imbricata TaxID=66713 RepID=A0AA88YD04_PINIB|nr:hypothetical protein FSP39_015864 [Pinctada imbricata]
MLQDEGYRGNGLFLSQSWLCFLQRQVVFANEIDKSDLVPKINEHGEVKDMDLIVNSMRVGAMMVKAGFIPDPRKNFPKIRDMKIFDDDILICAYQKAGTHWLWEIASMLNKGSSEYERKTKESVMLEFNDPDQFDNLARPRVLNTHLIFEALPKGILEKRCRVLYIQRNPKDMTVSCYNHMKGMRPPEAPKMVWDDYCYFSLTGQEPFVPWYKHREGFEQELDDRQDHILSLFYEDIKKVDPVTEIKKIASFLKVECSDDFATEIAEKCNFKNMKEADKKKEHMLSKDLNFLYRKGEVGDWKNWYTVAQNEKTDKLIAEKSKNSRFQYKYTLK